MCISKCRTRSCANLIESEMGILLEMWISDEGDGAPSSLKNIMIGWDVSIHITYKLIKHMSAISGKLLLMVTLIPSPRFYPTYTVIPRPISTPSGP